VPRFDGRVHLEKPPLAMWLMAASLKTFGTSEWALRLPLALCGGLCALCAYLLGGGARNPARALLAAGLTAAAPLAFAMARVATTDGVLAACAAGCLVCACRALEAEADPRRRDHWLSLAALLSGLGFLVKGPVVLIFTLLPVLLEGLLSRRPGHLGRVLSPLRVLLFAAVAVPWFLLLERRVPGSLAWLSGKRAVGALVSSESFHRGPVTYFVPVLLGGLFPAGVVLACSGRTAWRDVLSAPAGRLLALAVALPFLILSLSASKLATYLLPAAVPAAVLAASLLERGRGRAGVLACCAVLAAACLAVWFVEPVREQLAHAGLAAAAPAVLAACAGLAGAAGAARASLARGPRAGLGLLALAQLAVLLLFVRAAGAVDGGIGRLGSGKDVALAIQALQRPGEPVLSYDTLLCSLSFYLGHDVPTTEPHGKYGKDTHARSAEAPAQELADLLTRGSALVVCRPKDLPELLAQAPGAQMLRPGAKWSLVRAPSRAESAGLARREQEPGAPRGSGD
jgi:4-amino-4-deoxy-L-arabinose transferase-like glycosyltransferase